MKNVINLKTIDLFLRISLAIGFLSAVADRFGLWGPEVSAWGNWQAFLDYTSLINPWFPEPMIPWLGMLATAAEVIFAVFLLVGFKTELFAKLSGILLLLFGLSMTFSSGIKGPLDYSVFTAAAAAFALSLINQKHTKKDRKFPH